MVENMDRVTGARTPFTIPRPVTEGLSSGGEFKVGIPAADLTYKLELRILCFHNITPFMLSPDVFLAR